MNGMDGWMDGWIEWLNELYLKTSELVEIVPEYSSEKIIVGKMDVSQKMKITNMNQFYQLCINHSFTLAEENFKIYCFGSSSLIF